MHNCLFTGSLPCLFGRVVVHLVGRLLARLVGWLVGAVLERITNANGLNKIERKKYNVLIY